MSVITYAQRKVFLKWKLQPGEILSYKTIMEEIDTTKYKDFSVDFKGFLGSLGQLADDSNLDINKEIAAKKFMGLLNKYLNSDMMTYLTEKKKGLIDITMSYNKTDTASANTKDTSEYRMKDLAKMMQMMTKNVQLRGAINDSGSVESFYTKNDQKNLIALLFQLPAKQIKVGESWPLDIHFISMDQNFKCDTSYHKNLVTLVGIKKVNGETIAVLKYDVVEFVSGTFASPFEGTDKPCMMKIGCSTLAEFSVDKGRWVSYDGIMSLVASGVMNSHTTKKLSLQPN